MLQRACLQSSSALAHPSPRLHQHQHLCQHDLHYQHALRPTEAQLLLLHQHAVGYAPNLTGLTAAASCHHAAAVRWLGWQLLCAAVCAPQAAAGAGPAAGWGSAAGVVLRAPMVGLQRLQVGCLLAASKQCQAPSHC